MAVLMIFDGLEVFYIFLVIGQILTKDEISLLFQFGHQSFVELIFCELEVM